MSNGKPPPPPPRPPFCKDDGASDTTVVIRATEPPEDRPGMSYEPHTAPHVGPSTRVKVELGDLVKWGAAIVAATIWAWSLWSDVQRLKEETRELRAETKQMAEDVATIKRVVSLPGSFAGIPYATPEQPK